MQDNKFMFILEYNYQNIKYKLNQKKLELMDI